MIRASLFCVLVFAIFLPAAEAVTLDEAFEAALKKSEVIGQSQQKVIQAEETVSQARGGIMPNLALNGTYLLQDEPSNPTARQFSPAEQTTASLTLTQPLFRGLREFSALRQQKDLAAAVKHQRSAATLTLYHDLAASFLSVLTLERDVENLKSQLGLYEDRVKEMRGRARTGESRSGEVLTAQSAQTTLEAELEAVNGRLAIARNALSSMTGLPVNVVLTDPGLLAAGRKTNLIKLEDALSGVDRRPDVAATKLRTEAASEGVTIAKGAHWPSADLIGNYYLVRPESFMSDIDWDVQVRLTVPLFEGGATQSKVRDAVAKRTEAELELARVRRLASDEVRSAHQTIQTRLLQIDVLKRSVELAEKNYKVLRGEFRRGLSRSIDVQMAQTDLGNAKRAFDQAHFTAQLEMIRLKIATADMSPAIATE